MTWQIKYKGEVVKEHSTRLACVVEAFERKLVLQGPSIADFVSDPDPATLFLAGDWCIERAEE